MTVFRPDRGVDRNITPDLFPAGAEGGPRPRMAEVGQLAGSRKFTRLLTQAAWLQLQAVQRAKKLPSTEMRW
jgi:hypothetical protein